MFSKLIVESENLGQTYINDFIIFCFLVGDEKTSKEGSTVVSVPQIHDDNFSMFFGSMKSSPTNEIDSEMNSDFTGMKVETVRLL